MSLREPTRPGLGIIEHPARLLMARVIFSHASCSPGRQCDRSIGIVDRGRFVRTTSPYKLSPDRGPMCGNRKKRSNRNDIAPFSDCNAPRTLGEFDWLTKPHFSH